MTLLEQYQLLIRSLFEDTAPLFAPNLSKTNINDMEQVQKSAFKIILRGKCKNYDNALDILGEESLEDRREAISTKYAKKKVNHPKMKHLFIRKSNVRTRNGNMFVENRLKGLRGYNEPINYFTRLLNNRPSTKYS